MSEDPAPYTIDEAELVEDEAPGKAMAPAPTGQSLSVHPGTMIQALIASHKDIDIEKMTGLFELQKKYDDEINRKAFHAARSEFAGMSPTITHDGHVNFQSRSGDTTDYTFSSLGGAMDQVREALTLCGLNVSWKLFEEENNDIKVTCFLTHKLGYQEETSLSAPRSAGVGATGMNVLQGVKSTVSYLERITLFSLLGLASKADDDDGAGFSAQDIKPPALVTLEQAANLEALFTEVGGDIKPIFEHLQVDDWGQIPAHDFDRVLKKLEGRRNAAQ